MQIGSEKYFEVQSKDPYLLARLGTDMQMSGYTIENREKETTRIFNDGILKDTYLHAYPNNETNGYCGLEFHYMPDSCVDYNNPNTIKFDLTESNYLKVLKAILC